MKKVWLSKEAKKILRSLRDNSDNKNIKRLPNDKKMATDELEYYNFVKTDDSDKSPGFLVWITPTGESYIKGNPTLKNPMSKTTKWIIGLLIPVLTGIGSVLISHFIK